MTTREDNPGQDLMKIYSPDNCPRLIDGMTQFAEGVEADGLARALLPIYELSTDLNAREAVINLIRAAYDKTSEAGGAFCNFLERVKGAEGSPLAASAPDEGEAEGEGEASAALLESMGKLYFEAASALRSGDPDKLNEMHAGLDWLSHATRKAAPLTSAAREVDEAADHFAELVLKTRHNPRIRARVARMIEVRTDGGDENCEVIEPGDGETYLFTDRRGLPVLLVKAEGGYLVVEAKDRDGKIVNGLVADATAETSPRNRQRENAWQLIGELQELVDRGSVFTHVEKIVWAAQREEGDEEFERQVLADALALLLDSPHTPDDLRRAVADELLSISSDTKASDPLEPNNVREWFPIALERLAKKGGDQQADSEAQP